MSEAVTNIIHSFEQLAASEQHFVVVSLLQRAKELPQSALTDDDLSGLADELFLKLEQEEHGAAKS